MPSAKNKVQPQKNSHEHELDSKGVYQLANGTWAFRFCKSVNGKNRIFDIYDKTDDFVVIFDCVCDVEIFTDAEDSFYQIKTKKQTQAYTTTALCTAEKGKSGEVLSSILKNLGSTSFYHTWSAPRKMKGAQNGYLRSSHRANH